MGIDVSTEAVRQTRIRGAASPTTRRCCTAPNLLSWLVLTGLLLGIAIVAARGRRQSHPMVSA